MPLVGSAKERIRVMPEESIPQIQDRFVSKLVDRLHPIAKNWASKTAKLPNPTDAKSRSRYAGKLHFSRYLLSRKKSLPSRTTLSGTKSTNTTSVSIGTHPKKVALVVGNPF